MAAYAALVSLMHTINQIQHHPNPPISLDNEQVESLTEKITFLQDFLEGYSFHGSKEVDDSLEGYIADAAHAIEDIIESYIADLIHGRSAENKIWGTPTDLISFMDKGKKIGCFDFFRGLCKTSTHGKDEISSRAQPQILGRSTEDEISSIFYQSLQKMIEYMDLIKKEVMKIKKKIGVQDQLLTTAMPSGSSRSCPTGQNIMVSFGDVLYEMLDQLTGEQPDLQVIPIVGMGGLGKTTFAHSIYVNQLIVEHFDIRAWATISQGYSMRGILRDVLDQGYTEGMTEHELGEKLYKYLFGKRYLVVLDDIWSVEAWDMIQSFFPKRNNGSRIVITTRLSNLASQLTGSNYSVQLKLLDEVSSWNLLCKIVFEEEDCPLELEIIGKRIAKNCKGLPLSIVVIGGLLAKSEHTQEYWKRIAQNINSTVNLEDNERCLDVLYLSYIQLPVHLKPCFLYMRVFAEDHAIRVSELIKLWVAEGFLKPISEKSLEEVAKEYLKDLIDRNLILVHELGSTGSIKCCKIHDLLKDLCLREGERDRFYDVVRQPSLNLNIQKGIFAPRRIVIPLSISKVVENVCGASQSKPLVRPSIWDFTGVLPPLRFKLLRICKTYDPQEVEYHSLGDVFQSVNLRYVAVTANPSSDFTSSVSLLWNVQTLLVDFYSGNLTAPSDIWNMPQLRHVYFTSLHLPDPPYHEQDGFILSNLQMLGTIINFNCSQEVVRRIHNIRKLSTVYDTSHGVNSFDRLHKLESLHVTSHVTEADHFRQSLSFPHSLKKLTLQGKGWYWDVVLEKIGSLPLLEKLKLMEGSFKRPLWETEEGQFCSLKFLKISICYGLENWAIEYTHFPRLEHLVLDRIPDLKEIPPEIGEIPTLQSIELVFCEYSAVISAKRILDEQEELGDVGFQVRVRVLKKNETLESLASHNFHIKYGR